jgi:hypothetical protein
MSNPLKALACRLAGTAVCASLFIWDGGPAAAAPMHGVAVQVNEGKPLPTREQLQAVLRPGDFVRDMLGWHRVDRNCDLAGNPERAVAIPSDMMDLYQLVAAVGGRNFVSLGFNNKYCGQAANSGAKTFPNTDFLRAEFAAYAVRVVKQVPALGGISLWNEFTGTYKGGYAKTARAEKLADYCRLANTVITEVRKVDAELPIAIGATKGWDISSYFVDLFEAYGCQGRNDPTIWLDVHPYLSKKKGKKSDWDLWTENVQAIRTRGIGNFLIATEWGGRAASDWSAAYPSQNYVTTFDTKVVQRDAAWAGTIWFLLKASKKFPGAGLFDRFGALSELGREYIDAYGPP